MLFAFLVFIICLVVASIFAGELADLDSPCPVACLAPRSFAAVHALRPAHANPAWSTYPRAWTRLALA